MDPIVEATDRLIRAGRRLGAAGLISAGEGNLSVRLDADRLLVTPTGLRKDELDADDLVVVWLGHPEREAVSRSGRGPTSDLAIHLAVHAARPDIGAMAHAHLPAAMGLTLAGEVPGPVGPARDGAVPATPAVPVARDARECSELAGRIAARSRPNRPSRWPQRSSSSATAPCAVGRDPDQAVDRLELVEVLCRTWRDALLIRAARASLAIVETPSPGSDSRRDHERTGVPGGIARHIHVHDGRLHVDRRHSSIAAPARRTSWSCRSRSGSACWPRSSRSGTSRAAISIRP